MINLPDELNKHILSKAEKLQDFLDSNGHSIGIDNAINRLKNWCSNFYGLIPNMEVLIPVIDKLILIKDQNIIDRVIEELKRANKDINSDSIFISSLGGSNESSNRIIRNLNSKRNCIVNLHDCLNIIKKTNNYEAEIIFIDDFINSGGQFESIIKTLFGEKEKEGQENKRIILSVQEQELFKEIKTSFFFYYGMQTGRELADKTLKHFKLNSDIKIFEQYDDLKGIFGNTNSIEQIDKGLPFYADSSSIFSNYKCQDIKPFYDICKQIGEQYLRKTKPNWQKNGEEYKYSKRALGYGNSAQLFLTINNVPTSTLTAIWAEGEFVINGISKNWLSMFQRREKETGSEGHLENKGIIKTTDKKNLKCIENYLNKNLDINTNSNQSFETAFIIPLRQEYQTNSNNIVWKEDNVFLRNTTIYINKNKNIKTLSIKPSCLDFCNNRTEYKNKNTVLKIKYINAYKIIIGDYAFGIIRISFKQSEITLESCIKIVDSLSQIRSHSLKDNIFITPKEELKLSQIIHKVFEIDEANEIIEPRLIAFSFFRIEENNNIILNNLLNPLFNYKISSSKIGDIYANDNNTVKLIEAVITLSANGSALLCKPNYADNNSQLQERFFRQFLFLYLLGKVQNELYVKNFSSNELLSISDDICLVESEKEFYQKWKQLLRSKNGNITKSNY